MIAVKTACPACRQPYADSDGCTYAVIAFREPDGGGVHELDAVPYDHPGHVCHDCGTQHGNAHHVQCDAAECPRCGGQLLCCACDLVEFRPAA